MHREKEEGRKQKKNSSFANLTLPRCREHTELSVRLKPTVTVPRQTEYTP